MEIQILTTLKIGLQLTRKLPQVWMATWKVKCASFLLAHM